MEDKIETVGELIDYLECFDRGTKILDDINPCWWSPRSVDENEPESIIDAMCVATDIQLIDENSNTETCARTDAQNIRTCKWIAEESLHNQSCDRYGCACG